MKVLSWILFCLSLLCIVGMIGWGIGCIEDYRAAQALPSPSGVDFLGTLFYPLGFVAFSLLGTVFSLIGSGVCSVKVLQIPFWILAAIHSMVLLLSCTVRLR